MRKPILFTAGALLAGGLAVTGAAAALGAGLNDTTGDQEAEAAFTEAHRGEAAVSQADAERAALGAHPGRLSDTHLENEGHGLRWEVKSDDGATVWEIQVDARSGRIVSDHPDD